MAGMDYEHHAMLSDGALRSRTWRAWEILRDFQTEVATGNAEPLVEDGLLTKAMVVQGSDLSKDFESDHPRILLI